MGSKWLQNLKTKGLFRKIQSLVAAAQILFPKLPGKGSTGPQKRQWVIDQLNARVVDIPLLSESQEAQLIGILVDVVVDAWKSNAAAARDGS